MAIFRSQSVNVQTMTCLINRCVGQISLTGCEYCTRAKSAKTSICLIIFLLGEVKEIAATTATEQCDHSESCQI